MGDVLGDLGQRGRGGYGGLGVECGGQLIPAGGELLAGGAELGDDYRLCFGPTNVNIWSVGLAVEAMNGTEAVKRAERFDIPARTQRERAGHHWIDVARGFLLHGDHDKATRSLCKANRLRRGADPVARLAALALFVLL